MSIAEMNDRIRLFADKQCGQGATSEEIATAESSLRVAFPKSYRSFLETVGWGRFAHEEIYGLGSDAPISLQLVRNTVAERSAMTPQMPHHLIPVMNDGAGNHYCLDTSKFREGECPMVFWDHEQTAAQVPEYVDTSFDRWIIQLLVELSKA